MHSLEIGSLPKTQKVGEELASPSAEDYPKRLAESDTLTGPIDPAYSSGIEYARFSFDASEQEALVKQLGASRHSYELSRSLLPVTGRNFATQDVVTDGSADVDLGEHLTNPTTNEQLATDQIDHEFFESLLRSDLLNQTTSDTSSEDASASAALEVRLDLPFSPILPPYRSSLMSQETQPTPSRATKNLPVKYEVVRDYNTGRILHDSYLARLREAVDPAFSNDDWGDAYYFPGSSRFKPIGDHRINPCRGADSHAIMKGLKCRAMAIPERTVEESWKSFGDMHEQLGRTDNEAEDHLISFEVMKQGIQPCIREDQYLPLPLDLEPAAQRQKIIHGCRAMQAINAATLCGPGIEPFQVGAMPFVAKGHRSHECR